MKQENLLRLVCLDKHKGIDFDHTEDRYKSAVVTADNKNKIVIEDNLQRLPVNKLLTKLYR